MTDTGPAYPRAQTYGENDIGEGFAIGVSPVGNLSIFDVWTTVLSQYANSPAITSILVNYAAAADQNQDFSNFYDLIWNVDTAQGYGLDVWGRIVGVGRIITVASTDYFGFDQAVPGVQSWNLGLSFGGSWLGGALYSGTNLTSNFSLSDTAFRQLILAKAAANISNGSIPAVNAILRGLFPGRGNAYVTDDFEVTQYFGFAQAANESTGFGQAPFYAGENQGNVMQVTYIFDFSLSPVELEIVTLLAQFITGAGCKFVIVESP